MVALNFIDLGGMQFGLLHVDARAEERGLRGEVKWICRCACGGAVMVDGVKLRNGHTKSCGCLRRLSGTDSPNTDNRPILDRLAEHSHVVIETECKIWNGPRQVFGHGTISIAGKRALVHRTAWEAERGSIPDGLDCLHNCPGGDNPACWNVEHLWLGTQADNNADRDEKGRHIALLGEAHGGARLTEGQVSAMRQDRRAYAEIAADYNLSEGHVGDIVRGDNWKHLPGSASRKCGDNHCHAKITAEDVRAIRGDPRSGRKVAVGYGISPSNVYRIRSGTAWRHVT
jgi:hypothetical protein